MVVKILPSIMAKDQKELNARLKKMEGISSLIHLDVVDGKFVKSQSLWFNFKLSKKFQYTAHLMIMKPLWWIRQYGHKMKVCISQFEVIEDVEHYIEYCQRHTMKVGFALRPETKWAVLKPYLKDINYVLILTVKPGFYGSSFLMNPLRKIAKIKKTNPKIKIVVDGHMNPKTVKKAVKKGADFVVVGSYLQNAVDVKKAMKELKDAVRK